MKRNWKRYINKNRTEGDCQLVTAVNAYYYLTGKIVSDEDYEKYVDLAGCRYGSAISMEKVWKKLGIEIVWEGLSLLDLTCDIHELDLCDAICGRKHRLPLPIEFE